MGRMGRLERLFVNSASVVKRALTA